MNALPKFYTLAPNEGAYDIEDDGFQTVEFHDPAYWLQQDLYRYERMVNTLKEAVDKDDWDTIVVTVDKAYEAIHGPRE
jgi:hypothetical protein